MAATLQFVWEKADAQPVGYTSSLSGTAGQGNDHLLPRLHRAGYEAETYEQSTVEPS